MRIAAKGPSPGLRPMRLAHTSSLSIERVDGVGHGRQVGVNLVFEQAALFGVEALGLGRELHAFEYCMS